MTFHPVRLPNDDDDENDSFFCYANIMFRMCFICISIRHFSC